MAKANDEIVQLEVTNEGIQSVLKGLSLGKIASDIGKELEHQLKFGAHEMGAAIFSGSAFVMYPKAGQEDNRGIQSALEQIAQQGGVHGNEGHGLPEQAKEQEQGREI